MCFGEGVKRKGRYLVFGLSGSGKASLVELLSDEGLIDCVPYGHPTASEELSIGNMRG
jgi:ABC-type molybdenum transport system ATPase subunit/photorepair protein PhrA